jgi:hypothetical protein
MSLYQLRWEEGPGDPDKTTAKKWLSSIAAFPLRRILFHHR